MELQNAVLSGCQSDPVATSQALDDDDFDDWTEDDEEVLLNTVFYLFFCWIGTAFTFLKFISVSLPFLCLNFVQVTRLCFIPVAY